MRHLDENVTANVISSPQMLIIMSFQTVLDLLNTVVTVYLLLCLRSVRTLHRNLRTLLVRLTSESSSLGDLRTALPQGKFFNMIRV